MSGSSFGHETMQTPSPLSVSEFCVLLCKYCSPQASTDHSAWALGRKAELPGLTPHWTGGIGLNWCSDFPSPLCGLLVIEGQKSLTPDTNLVPGYF